MLSILIIIISNVLLILNVVKASPGTPTAKFLLVGLQAHSHLDELASIGEELSERGHDVTILLATGYHGPERLLRGGKIKPLHFPTPTGQHYLSSHEMDLQRSREIFSNVGKLQIIRTLSPLAYADCQAMLSYEFLEKMKTFKFDLAIVDRFIMAPYFQLIPFALNVPFVTVFSGYDPWLGGSPTLPSFFTSPGALQYSDRMTFVQRTVNLMSLILMRFGIDYVLAERGNYTLLEKFAPDVQGGWAGLTARAALHFVERDYVLDWPKPSMPNVILMPPATMRPTKELPDDLTRLVESSGERGLIVVSFGSVISYFPEDITRKILSTFSKLEQTVIWRYPLDKENMSNFEIPKNVHLMKWIPQADLLGSGRTRLFITHCGNNGQYESVYHGVPMIGFPLFAEQHFNAFSVEQRGYGIRMDMLSFTTEELWMNILKVLNDPSFARNVRHASSILRDSPMSPRQVAAHWIEHVLKFGADHLRSSAVDLAWYQYFMLDSIALLTALLLLIVYIVYALLRCIFQVLKSRFTVVKKADHGRKDKKFK